MVEFENFWRNTNSITDLEHNFEIFRQNLDKIFAESTYITDESLENGDIKKKLTQFYTYFETYYIYHKNNLPSRWLHIGLKLNFFHDPTNNTSETLNKIFKLKKNHFTFRELILKLKESLDHLTKFIEI